MLFENSHRTAKEIIDCAGQLLGEFQSCRCLDGKVVHQSTPPKQHWKPPTMGQLKINVDATVRQNKSFNGVGLVIRNEEGEVLMAVSKRIEGRFSPHVAECLAI